ncbi:DUF3293 domain-containing protein [Calidithermus timidus]|jgi:hypothetical protein|uniref:DUF3293 domain-containing protein n=1 Tax=Calidithermus timidus TaxID=307124 RepID=UPI000593D82B|nr:DUF3293 domain-containing protein [Calidithermus timidus]
MSTGVLSQVYRAAVYEAGGVAFTLSEEPTGVILFGGRAFAIITAHNPGSQPLPAEENARRHRELERLLREGGYGLTPSVNRSPEGDWLEEGFAVLGIGLEEALAVGRRFGQNAIVYGEGERVALAWCGGGGLEWFYPAQPNAIPGPSPGSR